MSLLFHLEADSQRFQKEVVAREIGHAKKLGLTTVLASGYFVTDPIALQGFLEILKENEILGCLQIPLRTYVGVDTVTDMIKTNKQIVGIILETSGDANSDEEGMSRSIKEILSMGKSASVRIWVAPNSEVDMLERWLTILEGTDISDLITESDSDYIEVNPVKKEQYFKVLMKHSAFLEKIQFQCTFLAEFTPNKCIYLATPCLMFRNGEYVLCPHETTGVEKEGKGDIPFALERIKSIQKKRLLASLHGGERFTCQTCKMKYQ